MRTTFSATATISCPVDAGVDCRLEHVDHEVEKHEEQRQHQNGALQERQIALEDRGIEQEPGARPREHRLDQDGSAKQIAELQAHNGNYCRRRVLDDVKENSPFPQALGTKRIDEFLRQEVADE